MKHNWYNRKQKKTHIRSCGSANLGDIDRTQQECHQVLLCFHCRYCKSHSNFTIVELYNFIILQSMNEWAVPSIFSIGSEEVYSVKSNRVGSVLNKLLQQICSPWSPQPSFGSESGQHKDVSMLWQLPTQGHSV